VKRSANKKADKKREREEAGEKRARVDRTVVKRVLEQAGHKKLERVYVGKKENAKVVSRRYKMDRATALNDEKGGYF